jgi:hypothetical protein
MYDINSKYCRWLLMDVDRPHHNEEEKESRQPARVNSEEKLRNC